jgi:hypothetical protein
VAIELYGGPVGEPAIGPTAFPHRGIERESMHRLLKNHGVRSEDFKPRG